MKNKILAVTIFLLVIVICVLAYFLFASKGNSGVSKEKPVENKNGVAVETLSEQPNKEKFNEYFTNASLGKIPANEKFDPFKMEKTKIFTSADQFCTSLDIKKNIKNGSIGGAVYDVNKKEYASQKSIFPVELKAGNSIGCESLEYPVGKYEQKIYIDDVLTIVLPFEVK